MKKQLLTLSILLLMCFSLLGQSIHSPQEIFQIMEKSSISFELSPLEVDIPVPDRSDKLNYNTQYRVEDSNGIVTYNYEISEETKKYYDQAEKHFHNKDFVSARQMYLKAFETDTTFFQVLTYVGQTFGIEKNFNEAINWYRKAIDLNYIDYMAHWFLADAYKEIGELRKAVDEITIAMILNRNNARIKKSFDNIYNLKRLKSPNWTFNPQIKIDSTGVNKVRIAFKSEWMGYAMVKSLWMFEPNYKESMGIRGNSISTLEERECFVSLMTTLDKKAVKNNPHFKALQKSIDKNMIDEFIFYEIVLLNHPFVAYHLDKNFIVSIKDYVIKIRSKIS